MKCIQRKGVLLKLKLLIAITAMVLLFLATSLKAEKPNWRNGIYVGGGLGKNFWNNHDAGATALKVFLGYELAKYLDLEISYNKDSVVTEGGEITSSSVGLGVTNRYTENGIQSLMFELKPKFNLTEKQFIFAIGGFEYSKFRTALVGYTSVGDYITLQEYTTNSNYVNLGVGYEYVIGSNIGSVLNKLSLNAQYRYSLLTSTKYNKNNELANTLISKNKNSVFLVLKFTF